MIAIIDIGSNSVRLMLWADGKVFYKRVNTTRLGEGLAQTSMLSPDAISRTAHAVAQFYEEGRRRNAAVYAFATAAVRSAKNGREFCEMVKSLCGLDVDVVSGEREALLAVNGALGKADGGVIDIGGASTELCMRKGGKITFSESLGIGAVRLYDLCKDDEALLEIQIEKAISPIPDVSFCGRVYAIGGTASTLAAVMLGLDEYSAEKIQGLKMSFGAVQTLTKRLLSMPMEERGALRGMDIRRADIIASGAMLLERIMKKFSLEAVYASDRDNLEGYLITRGLT